MTLGQPCKVALEAQVIPETVSIGLFPIASRRIIIINTHSTFRSAVMLISLRTENLYLPI